MDVEWCRIGSTVVGPQVDGSISHDILKTMSCTGPASKNLPKPLIARLFAKLNDTLDVGPDRLNHSHPCQERKPTKQVHPGRVQGRCHGSRDQIRRVS